MAKKIENKIFFDQISRLDYLSKEKDGTIFKVYSGLEELDNLIGGFRSKQLYVVSARAGVGKTSLLVSIFANLAQQNIPSFLFSLELGAEEIACRFARNILMDEDFQFDQVEKFPTLIAYHKKKNKKLFECQKNIYFDANSYSIENLEKLIKENSQKIRVYGVDFTGLIQIEIKGDTPDWKRLGMIVENLKRIANENNVVLFLINHLNRATTNNNAMSEQGGSIDFERLATCIMQIYSLDSSPDKRVIKITKNRMGKLGECVLNFDGRFDLFF
jgi:replicative DNA helicase